MKARTIALLLRKKFEEFVASIEDETVRTLVNNNTIITGGCITSMLLKEAVNDYDLYFTNAQTTEAVARYYVNKFDGPDGGAGLRVDVTEGRIRIVTENGWRGETAGNVEQLGDAGTIEEVYEQTEKAALNTTTAEEGPAYRPVFLSTNAITLSGKVQIVLRFYGAVDEIHQNYDFVHCTNAWESSTGKLTLRQEALEAILARELRYVGSKYPVCSVIRLRKFIARGWQINAGQILKMLMQISDLNLHDPLVLEDQLTGVDSAYFCQLMKSLREKDPEKVSTAYLVEIIGRLF